MCSKSRQESESINRMTHPNDIGKQWPQGRRIWTIFSLVCSRGKGGGGLYSKKPSKEGPKKSSRWRAVWCIFCNAHVVNRCILSQILLSQTRRQGHASNLTKQLVINALWPNLLWVPIKVGISFVDSRRYGHSRIFSAYFTNESFIIIIGKKS